MKERQQKKVVKGNFQEENIKVQEFSKAEKLEGNLGKETEENKLMHSVMENDKETIEEGKIIKEAINQNVGSFTPDIMLEQHVNNYGLAQNIYGDKILSFLSGYDDTYLKKNIQIPEFQRELKKIINEKIEKMKEKKVITHHGDITEKGITLASLTLYTEELNKLTAKGLIGEKTSKQKNKYGIKQDARAYKKGDRYKDIAIKKSAKTAIRRGHNKIKIEDLQTYEREGKGQINIIYGIDASGSMKGQKIETSKKAGIALAYKAIEAKDKVGLIIFGTEIKEKIEPTLDFFKILKGITQAKASKETNLASTIKEAITMFPQDNTTKHITLITDALPTTGLKPEEESIKAAGTATEAGITISIIGINLDKKGEEIAKKITEIGQGKLYKAKELDEVDHIILEDYYAIS